MPYRGEWMGFWSFPGGPCGNLLLCDIMNNTTEILPESTAEKEKRSRSHVPALDHYRMPAGPVPPLSGFGAAGSHQGPAPECVWLRASGGRCGGGRRPDPGGNGERPGGCGRSGDACRCILPAAPCLGPEAGHEGGDGIRSVCVFRPHAVRDGGGAGGGADRAGGPGPSRAAPLDGGGRGAGGAGVPAGRLSDLPPYPGVSSGL